VFCREAADHLPQRHPVDIGRVLVDGKVGGISRQLIE
jgi:hypothetical protein